MRIPGLIAGPAIVAVAVTAFVRPAPIAQYFVDAQQGSRGQQSAMTSGLVRVLAVRLATIGIGWTLLSIFGHPE
ncbi:hypothetical protein BIU98_01920 [Curtobacterium sp. MMLR14_010]|uniref:hypothetical protein n=1 Tax=Curtobacterium sp. MMLR14_010 TaxID=1898743 RepID=UPI0008DE354F|nr:hypothetical protein [Curtobacterium sp. MMLR14_010]OII34748.1 hypothetical protein BIU98_01920 [Curtobacterium sp. MMLR14_010]